MEILKEKKTLYKTYVFKLSFEKPSYYSFLKGSFKLFSDDYFFKVGLCFLGDYCINFMTYWNRHMDHAGFGFTSTIFGVSLVFNVLDNRHWDFVENNWKNFYEEEVGTTNV
jgi:hypothetical protein